MKATIYCAARDVRLEDVPDPTIRDPRDAIVRVTRAGICGSDLWFYRGVTQLEPGAPIGHEFVGIVEEVGSDVHSVQLGDPVISPFVTSDGTCEFCRAGLQSSCVNVGFFTGVSGGQAELVKVAYADSTLVKMPETIARDEKKHYASVALCDVMATGHHGVVSAQTKPGSVIVIVGDGAVGLCAVLSAAKLVGAERVIAVGHNPKRLEIAKRFGATETLDSHKESIREQILELTPRGAAHVVEAVGNQESLDLAVSVARPGGTVCFLGVPHNVKTAPLDQLLFNNVSLRGGMAPARAYLPQLIASLEAGRIDPSPVLDLELPLSRVAEGYAAMDERRAIKVLLAVS
jgi:threonine dehydrogenase-like Zn-dependent dehydrogenase